MKGEGLKIRYRTRVNASPPAGLRQEWNEYQVVAGRRIVGRYDLLSQAREEYPGAALDITVTAQKQISAARRSPRDRVR